VYRKLGLRSRAELARHFAQQGSVAAALPAPVGNPSRNPQ
jgi:hypothetical protein